MAFGLLITRRLSCDLAPDLIVNTMDAGPGTRWILLSKVEGEGNGPCDDSPTIKNFVVGLDEVRGQRCRQMCCDVENIEEGTLAIVTVVTEPRSIYACIHQTTPTPTPMTTVDRASLSGLIYALSEIYCTYGRNTPNI